MERVAEIIKVANGRITKNRRKSSRTSTKTPAAQFGIVKKNGAIVHGGHNIPMHVVKPGTASQIRKTLGITQAEIKAVLRALQDAGVTA